MRDKAGIEFIRAGPKSLINNLGPQIYSDSGMLKFTSLTIHEGMIYAISVVDQEAKFSNCTVHSNCKSNPCYCQVELDVTL